MSNVLSDEKQSEILALGRLGWPARRIEQATGVRRETISAYLKAAGIAVRRPGRWGREGPAKPANEVSTDSAGATDPAGGAPASAPPPAEAPAPGPPPARRAPRASACEPYREKIEAALRSGRNATAIYQDLVTGHAFPARYASVMRFVRRLRGARTPQPCGVIATPPGEEAQVDYGDGPMVRDPERGKYRRVRLFLLTLGYSRKAVRLLTPRSSTQIWAALHEEAFRRLGGAPAVVVLDNLREGVLRPDVYDPTLNPLYRDVLAHYGVVALPCRVGDPDRKGKVEAGIGHTQRTPLRGLRFETLADAQRYLDHWDARWADTRIHGTTKRQVAAMFAEERPHLRPLPVEPFRYYAFGTRTVHLDGRVEVAGAYYPAPPGRIGQRLPVQWDERRVRLLDPRSYQLLCEHERVRPGTYAPTDPEAPPARTPPTTRALLARAAAAGEHIGAVCAAIYDDDGDRGIRRILGVLALARRYGAPAVEDACAAARELAMPTYRFVRRYLERPHAPRLALRQIDPLIRELTQYRDIIHRMTTPEDPS